MQKLISAVVFSLLPFTTPIRAAGLQLVQPLDFTTSNSVDYSMVVSTTRQDNAQIVNNPQELPREDYRKSSKLLETGLFTEPPRLVDSATTQNATAVPGATYYLTISLPENAGAPLEEIQLEQTSGVEFIGHNIEQTKAFKGTRDNQGKQLFVQLVDENSNNRTLSVRLDPPLPPGETVTIALNPVLTPRSRGVYQFSVKAFPPGENARGLRLGFVRLHFYNRRQI